MQSVLEGSSDRGSPLVKHLREHVNKWRTDAGQSRQMLHWLPISEAIRRQTGLGLMEMKPNRTFLRSRSTLAISASNQPATSRGLRPSRIIVACMDNRDIRTNQLSARKRTQASVWSRETQIDGAGATGLWASVVRILIDELRRSRRIRRR